MGIARAFGRELVALSLRCLMPAALFALVLLLLYLWDEFLKSTGCRFDFRRMLLAILVEALLVLPMAPGFRVALSLSTLAGGDCYLRGGRLLVSGRRHLIAVVPVPSRWVALLWYCGRLLRLPLGACLPLRLGGLCCEGGGHTLRRAPRRQDRQACARQEGGESITLCIASGATPPHSEASHDRRGEHITLCMASGVTSLGVVARLRRRGGAHNALQCERCDFPQLPARFASRGWHPLKGCWLASPRC